MDTPAGKLESMPTMGRGRVEAFSDGGIAVAFLRLTQALPPEGLNVIQPAANTRIEHVVVDRLKLGDDRDETLRDRIV